MNDDSMKDLLGPTLFFVTGFCFFVFGKILRYLNGSDLPVFTWTGIIAILIGSIISVWKIKKKTEK